MQTKRPKSNKPEKLIPAPASSSRGFMCVKSMLIRLLRIQSIAQNRKAICNCSIPLNINNCRQHAMGCICKWSALRNWLNFCSIKYRKVAGTPFLHLLAFNDGAWYNGLVCLQAGQALVLQIAEFLLCVLFLLVKNRKALWTVWLESESTMCIIPSSSFTIRFSKANSTDDAIMLFSFLNVFEISTLFFWRLIAMEWSSYRMGYYCCHATVNFN